MIQELTMPEETPEESAAFYAEQDANIEATRGCQEDVAVAAHEANIAADGVYESPPLSAALSATRHYCRITDGVVTEGWYDIPSGQLEMENPDAGNFRNGETIEDLRYHKYRKQAKHEDFSAELVDGEDAEREMPIGY